MDMIPIPDINFDNSGKILNCVIGTLIEFAFKFIYLNGEDVLRMLKRAYFKRLYKSSYLKCH